ncbi:MAG: SoxR reducing system RseC family protein [Tissierellia bacterium]|nr:SoxR reducing system RseC family protein [Tissierellia bacterium]
MEQVGRVVSTNDGMASLEVRKVSACGTNCASCAASCEQEPMKIDVIDSLGVKPGEYVEIKADGGQVLKYMLLLYGLPLLFMIIGFGVSHSYFQNAQIANYELMSLLVGLVALTLGALIVRSIDKKSNIKSYNINHMVRKL